MDPASIEACLAGTRPEDRPDLLRLIELFEQAGCTAPHEPARWRRRIRAWRALRHLCDDPEPF